MTKNNDESVTDSIFTAEKHKTSFSANNETDSHTAKTRKIKTVMNKKSAGILALSLLLLGVGFGGGYALGHSSAKTDPPTIQSRKKSGMNMPRFNEEDGFMPQRRQSNSNSTPNLDER